MIEQDKELKTVKDINQKEANEGASGTNISISEISQDGNDTPFIFKKLKTKTTRRSILIQNENKLKNINRN